MSLESKPYYTETYTIFLEPIQNPSPMARTFDMNRSNRPPSKSVLSAFGYGLGAGLVGITAMSITQTIEQHITGRSTSRVPGETILKFFKNTFRHAQATCSRKGRDKEMSPEEESDETENLARPPSEGYPSYESESSAVANWAAYLGQGAVLGGLRGVLSYYGVRGLVTDLVFTGFISSGDYTRVWSETDEENGALTRPIVNSLPEVMHQVVYAFVTGFFCDHWVN